MSFKKSKTFFAIFLLLFFPFMVSAQVSLDDAAANCARYLQGRFSRGTRAALVTINCESPELSDIVLRRLSTVLVNGGWFTVVERSTAALAIIDREMDRHLNAFVSEATELSIGKQLGAEVIISGSFTRSGQNWKLDIKTLGVESAQITAQWSGDVRNDTTWAALISPRSASVQFDGDAFSSRDTQTIISGLRTAMQTYNTSLDLIENTAAGAGYVFKITIYKDQTVSALLRAEATVTFSHNGRVLFQTGPYHITETTDAMIARRIIERLRDDRAFFNRVNEAIR